MLGNLKSRVGSGLGQASNRTYDYTGSGRPHAPHTVNDTTYHYDANGNQELREGLLAPLGHQELKYNDFDMPWEITTGTGAAQFVTHLEYDAFERRVAKRLPGEETLYAGDLYEHVTTPAGIEHRYKVFAGDSQVAQVTKAELNGVVTGSERVRYIHDDHLGSTTAITGEIDSETEIRTFGPFGEQTIDFTTTGVRSGFTGHEHDNDIGLINMRGRLYDPTIGQFLQPDPFITTLNPRGLNRYAYVMNNPTTFVDPTGFYIDRPLIGGGGGPIGTSGVDRDGDGVPDSEPGGTGGGNTGGNEILDLTQGNIIYHGVVTATGSGGSSGGSRGSSEQPPDVTVTTGPSFGGGTGPFGPGLNGGGPNRPPDPGAGAGLGEARPDGGSGSASSGSGLAKGKSVGRVVQIGIQKIKEFFSSKPGKLKNAGARATLDDLVEAVKAGEDVIVDSPSIAREIARKAGGGKAPTLHRVKPQEAEQGFLPHYHPHGSKSHVFFEPTGNFGLKDLLDLVGPVLVVPFEQLAPPDLRPGGSAGGA